MNLKKINSAQPYNKTLISPVKPGKPNKVSNPVSPVAIKTYKPHTHNLPVSLTPFIGRHSEVEEICRLVNKPAVHLVTLYGTAGLGKTRLGLAVGEALQYRFRDGVYFVNLTPITRPESGLAAIAQALGLLDQRRLPLLEKLKHYLYKKALLLILDNFEQVVELGAAVSELLSAAPLLKVIVTSRVVLRLYSEYVYRVPPFHLPKIEETTPLENLCENEAVRLFCQRAKMVNSQFELTRERAETIVKICDHLEGLPLSIELAAASCDVFSPQTLLDRLMAGKRFELLNGGFTNLAPHQQTLGAALEWSYQLLNEPEKQLFRRFGIFAGSCSLEAAQAVGGGPSSLESIISLINKSLFKQVEAMPGEELRFTMLETIREFALEKLDAMGEVASARAAYNRYFIEMAEIGAGNLKKENQLIWLKRLAADHANILSALDYFIENEEVKNAFRLGSSIWLVWWRWGYLNQGRKWLQRILALQNAKVEETLYAKVLDGLAYLAMYQSDYQSAEVYFEQSLQIWRENGLSKYLGRAISGLAGTYRTLGNYERALELNYEALALFRQIGEAVSEADSMSNIASQLMERGNYEQVQSMLEEAIAIHLKNGYLTGVARSKIYLADMLWRKNDLQGAIQHIEEGVALLRQFNHRIQLPKGLYRQGLIYLCQGELALAGEVLEECVEIAEEMDTKIDLTYAYSIQGLLKILQNDLAGAEIRFHQALKLRSEVGQLEGVLWAIEGLALVSLKMGKTEQAQKMTTEGQNLRKAIFAPVLPHTLEFILPAFLNHNKPANNLADQPKSQPAIKDLVEKVPSTTTLMVKPPASFGLDEAITLSKREYEVLNLIAQGHRTNQIADLLVISPGTVNTHLNSIYSKLGVNSRTAAIRYAIDHRFF